MRMSKDSELMTQTQKKEVLFFSRDSLFFLESGQIPGKKTKFQQFAAGFDALYEISTIFFFERMSPARWGSLVCAELQKRLNSLHKKLSAKVARNFEKICGLQRFHEILLIFTAIRRIVSNVLQQAKACF